MMKFPRIQGGRRSEDVLVSFGGLNMTDKGGRGEFADMKNMSSDRFPHMTPRRPRGTVQTRTKLNGFCMREKPLICDGTECFYGETKAGDLTDGRKKLVSFGAYVLIFPDKKYYNTQSGEFGDMEKTFLSAGTVEFKQSWLTETDKDPEGQVYVDIHAAGIDTAFEKGDGVTISGAEESSLNKTAVIQDKGNGYIKIIGPIEKDSTQTAALTIKRELPEMDYMTVCKNRLWGCSSKNHEVYASKLGSAWNFHVFNGTGADSYAATVATDGDFTGAVTYGGKVLFFKENEVYKVLGNAPRNFEIHENKIRGIEKGSADSAVIVDEMLFYKSPDGVMGYQGAIPFSVGEELGEGYKNASGGACGGKYYISMEKDGKYHLFVYDAGEGVWHKEDNTRAEYFQTAGDKLYYADGNTIKLAEGNDKEAVQWEAETTDFYYQGAESKFISRLLIRMQVPTSSVVNVWIDYDSKGDWKRLASIGGTVKNTVNIPIIPKRCDHFRLKFDGVGAAILYNLTLYLMRGSYERRG